MDERAKLIKIVSVDDHVVEPPNLWQDRVPARYRDVAPRIVRERVGEMNLRGGQVNYNIGAEFGRAADVWAYEELRLPIFRTGAAVGFDRDEMTMTPMTFEEMRPGCYDPAARLDDMDLNGVEASLCFPNMFVRFCGQTFHEAADRALAKLCVEAYNDWMIDEWCGSSGGRLVPLCIVPLWDPALAAAEVYRNAARGARAVCFSELPTYLGLPSIHTDYWEPFFHACTETGTVINMHIGSASRFQTTSEDAPGGVANTLTFVNAAMSLTDWIMSGVLVRHPNLELAFAECQIGWLPYVLERADESWEGARGWNEVWGKIPDPPSSYFRRQVRCAFFDDAHGIRSLDEIGVDRVLFETDYPHTDSTWPDSPKKVDELVAQLGIEQTRRIVRTNAIEMLRLDLDP